MSEYLGLDTGGQSNNWLASLRAKDGSVALSEMPRVVNQEDILNRVTEANIAGLAIDGQITWSYTDTNGFRPSDLQIREYLQLNCPNGKNWVQSYNSLQVVPLKSRQIAELVNPHIGILIETHPRVNLFLKFKDQDASLLEAIHTYKRDEANGEITKKLWNMWCESFCIKIECEEATDTIYDGQLDSLVCASICYAFHNNYQTLRKLQNGPNTTRGFGPFYVLDFK
ncbi:MAG: hypothetical protein GVY26_19215 [Bacteroidetes bacterium]|jgi:hypothetical protein|nr:hypothetical protein [Bacteroidota bacterium]